MIMALKSSIRKPDSLNSLSGIRLLETFNGIINVDIVTIAFNNLIKSRSKSMRSDNKRNS